MSNRHGAYEGPLFSYLERPEPIRSRLWRRANFALTEFSEVRLRRHPKEVALPAEVGVQELVETLVVGREEPL
jgi:hypothetical protein